MKHDRRFYRNYNAGTGTSFNVKLDTTDLLIKADSDLHDQAYRILREIRADLERHISSHENFLYSLDPIEPPGDEPDIAASMYIASAATGTGPMSAVAGAVAEAVGRGLLELSGEVIVENGGDIWMKLIRPTVIGLYINNIHFGSRIALKIYPDNTPCSICTSSPRLGHSLSFGKADSVTVIADNGALADSAATAVCNMIKNEQDIRSALTFAMSINGISGCIAVFREKLAVQGRVELAPPE